MQANRLEIIRQTKLDLATWIVAGIGQCRNQAAALSLARYAAAQLEAAAWIPAPLNLSRNAADSLLRRELRMKSGRQRPDSTAVLTRVSREMLRMLTASQSRRNAACVRLARHELRAAGLLQSLIPDEIGERTARVHPKLDENIGKMGTDCASRDIQCRSDLLV